MKSAIHTSLTPLPPIHYTQFPQYTTHFIHCPLNTHHLFSPPLLTVQYIPCLLICTTTNLKHRWLCVENILDSQPMIIKGCSMITDFLIEYELVENLTQSGYNFHQVNIDMEKCGQENCCLYKYQPDGWNLLQMFTGTYL